MLKCRFAYRPSENYVQKKKKKKIDNGQFSPMLNDSLIDFNGITPAFL